MELRLIEKDKTSIRIQILDPDATLIRPLVEELLANPKVESAMYKEGHPGLDTPELLLNMRSGKPETALKAAAKTLGQRYKDLKDIVGAKMDKL